MGDVINLKLHRKRKDREAKEAVAAANRTKFGRTKAEKEATRAVVDLETRRLDGHRRTPDDEDGA